MSSSSWNTYLASVTPKLLCVAMLIPRSNWRECINTSSYTLLSSWTCSNVTESSWSVSSRRKRDLNQNFGENDLHMLIHTNGSAVSNFDAAICCFDNTQLFDRYSNTCILYSYWGMRVLVEFMLTNAGQALLWCQIITVNLKSSIIRQLKPMNGRILACLRISCFWLAFVLQLRKLTNGANHLSPRFHSHNHPTVLTLGELIVDIFVRVSLGGTGPPSSSNKLD